MTTYFCVLYLLSSINTRTLSEYNTIRGTMRLTATLNSQLLSTLYPTRPTTLPTLSLLGQPHKLPSSWSVEQTQIEEGQMFASLFLGGRPTKKTQQTREIYINNRQGTSSLSSLALWFLGSCLNSSVNRKHWSMFSGDTKSRATFVHDCSNKHKV